FDPATGNEVQLPFDEVTTQFVQLVVTENSGAGGGQIAEFEIYSK
ncbi:MAG: coagulation factor 5/8 type domain protein, partial [Herbinix sp.]|nr:coagulation factor 5/8 type domain protein [Herbinix sp.]